jgi:hypothetical protein
MVSSALSNALSWVNVFWWVKVGAAGIVALGVFLEFAGDWFSRPFEKTIDDARTEEIARLTTEAEALRNQNLELEKAVSPRVLERTTTAKALSQFAGVPFVVISPADFEPKRTAGQIRFVLDQAKWVRFTEPLNLAQFPFFDGVSVHAMGIISKPNDLANTAAQALVSVLNDHGIVATQAFPPMWLDEQGRPIPPKMPLSSNPPNVVIVEVGPKPLPESLKMRPPSKSDAAGNKTWGNIAE